ncbi:hypothetical protein SAMN00790413_04620 [Deinococcus hopiensis KR-140]|uniref:Uncharacterized protein n=1 Tax=Deinococcus hopiensis KR-140 TaxID=695939 RepID=A0A1W1UKF6_9DEIO|nr:hypothetical protein SAMN00790413_04620 [Deinococcus hopiensis KR-140]
MNLSQANAGFLIPRLAGGLIVALLVIVFTHNMPLPWKVIYRDFRSLMPLKKFWPKNDLDNLKSCRIVLCQSSEGIRYYRLLEYSKKILNDGNQNFY